MIDDKLRKEIMESCISLEKFGLNDLCWKKEDAEKLIHSIIEESIGILGGDVYKLTSGQLEALSDNWSCEQKNFESKKDYYLRSKMESLNYIDNYPENQEGILFSITFTEEI